MPPILGRSYEVHCSLCIQAILTKDDPIFEKHYHAALAIWEYNERFQELVGDAFAQVKDYRSAHLYYMYVKQVFEADWVLNEKIERVRWLYHAGKKR